MLLGSLLVKEGVYFRLLGNLYMVLIFLRRLNNTNGCINVFVLLKENV